MAGIGDRSMLASCPANLLLIILDHVLERRKRLLRWNRQAIAELRASSSELGTSA